MGAGRVSYIPDDIRYMDYETRVREGYMAPGEVPKPDPEPVYCHCGKTCYRDGFGISTGNHCPRGCETDQAREAKIARAR
jgi:hypothetical protein